MTSYKDEKERWNKEVESEAARLIIIGTPPTDALEMAGKNVSDRRKRKAQADMQRKLGELGLRQSTEGGE